jgi:molecular chaperone DnaK (HSP70)
MANSIQKFENIMVCDCGGGTVDITTYSMVEVEPRLEFEELLVGIGMHAFP